MTNRLLFVYTVLAMLNSALWAATCHVAPGGDDNNPGTEAKPFKSFANAVLFLADGGTCIVHEGRYTEPINIIGYQKATPIYIKAAEGERVILDGREPVKGAWTRHSNSIYRTAVTGAVEQVFFKDQMMVEARWPNMKLPDELWDRSKWASAAEGSKEGLMVSHKLATTGVNWTGAMAVLNISHQFWTWTSPVIEHTAGEDRFRYATENLAGIMSHRFDNDRYYLTGILAALDTVGEWHHDREQGLLYVWAPDGKQPLSGSVSVKQRHHGLVVKNSSNIHISGIHFFGCAFDLSEVSKCVIEDCHLRYPGFSREITERYKHPHRRLAPCASIKGDHNVVRKCSIGYSSGTGLRVKGAYNLIEDNLIHDVCWSGSLDYSALYIVSKSKANTARHNTLLNSGNVLLHLNGPDNVAELNHVYNGGRACMDVSLVYTSLPLCAGTEIRYNWVHGCYAPHIALGIRGDDKTRKLRVHHNVTWDCAWEGIVVKGDENLVYNNTGFRNGRADIMMYSGPEPHKDWHKKWPPVPEENKHSKVFNNLGWNMRGHRGKDIPPGGFFVNNHQVKYPATLLRDRSNRDFRPAPNSAIVDAGTVIDGLPSRFSGKAPDIGAYEADAEPWIPGITWDPKEVLGFVPSGYE